jgi:hypothetical protein
LPRKDGVRGNSKKKESYSKKDWRASHPDNQMKGGKKTSKRLTIERESSPVLMTTPFAPQDFEIAKQIKKKYEPMSSYEAADDNENTDSL